MSDDLPTPGRALAVGAHPDDIEFGCGGTLAKWAARGCDVRLVVCTDGSKGSWDPAADRDALVLTRQEEARDAARRLGASPEVTFLGWVDGEVEPSREAVAAVAAAIRRHQPDVVLAHDPWKRYRLHPDHRHVGWISLDATVAAAEPHALVELGLAPHRPATLLLFEADEPDHTEDVTGYAEDKVGALLAHRSQYRSTMHIEDPDDRDQVEAFRRLLLDRLAEAGQDRGVAAGERFKVMQP